MAKGKEVEIESLKPQFDSILEEWGFTGKDKDKKRIVIQEWLENFENTDEIKYAIEILKAVQYKTANDIQEKILDLAGNLIKKFQNDFKDVLFFPLGKSSNSSGSMYLYQYSKELKWSVTNDNFPKDDFKNHLDKKLVFFDDMIGSGNQAITFANENLKELEHLPYYASVYGITDGIKKIKESGLYEEVFAGGRISNCQLAFHKDSDIFKDDERETIKRICKKYGEELYPAHPLGYDDTQSLLGVIKSEVKCKLYSI